MDDFKALALKVAAAKFHYEKIKDTQVKPHVAKANHLRFIEAMAEFNLAAADMDEKFTNKILKWGYEVVEARVELHKLLQDSPPVRLFQILMGYNRYWCFAGYKLNEGRYPFQSELKDRDLGDLISLILSSPEREIAMEALTLLAGAVQNWSLSALVDVRMAINDIKRKEQGSFSKAEVIEILERIILKAQEGN